MSDTGLRIVRVRRNLFELCAVILCLTGCSVINFSANYYTPPRNYQHEIVEIWQKVKQQIPLKHDYNIILVEGQDSRKLKGIPAISNNTVVLPQDFVKYVYQNYYDDRARIFASVIVHELTHREYDIPSRPAEKHFQADVAAIKLLGDNRRAAEYYYKSLYVVKNYWFARKGVAGHTLNASWNILNGVSYAVGGPACFADFFATDLSQRMNLLARHYHLPSGICFERSKEK